MTPVAATQQFTLPGAMLQRGFWLYVWRVTTPLGEMLYVGRTGDSSSPKATAPYTRMGQHLGFAKTQNSLRKLLTDKGVSPETCISFELISHGPIYPEIGLTANQDRETQMVLHKPVRDKVAAMEKKLRDDLKEAGYTVLNVVHCKKYYDDEVWSSVRQAFSKHFPLLKTGGQ
jgi:hypothetical protein